MQDAEDETGLAELYRSRLNILTWERSAKDIDHPVHQARLRRLEVYAGATFGPDVYVASRRNFTPATSPWAAPPGLADMPSSEAN